MAKKPDDPKHLTGLRRQAEELLRMAERDVAAMPVKDVQQLVHELQVHQVELEMQNDELRRTQVELQAARDRYEDLYDFSPAGHLTLDRDGTIVEASLRAGLLLGNHRKELIGQSLARFVTPDDQDLFHRHCQEVLKNGTRQTCEVHIRKKAGASDCVHLESLAVHEEFGHITHWRTSLLDISDRRRTEQELEAQRTQLNAIIESAMDAIITVDAEGRVLLFNRAAQSMFGCRADDAIGQLLDRFIPERFREAHHGHMSFFARGGVVSRTMQRGGTLYGLRSNGEEFPIEASISRVLLVGKTLLTVILRDVTERSVAARALEGHVALLREKQSELESLTQKLLQAQEQERKRIARDLHDDFNQRLAALAVELETLERNLIVHLPEPISRQCAEIRAGIGRLSDDLHDLAYNLHPSLLDHVGLEVAMRDHVAEFTKRTGLPATFTPREVPKVLSPEVKTNLFRVLQESLQNVLKHAHASRVTVRLSGSSKGVGVSERDNGKGFDLESKAARVKGLGLTSMQERARLLGGFFRVHSLPADGTKVCVWIPRSQEDA
ncbi:MAG: PAS domain S-box protein [Nitrospira sp.]|nr:PAS domain S-box protein [Nitrospira sp.]